MYSTHHLEQLQLTKTNETSLENVESDIQEYRNPLAKQVNLSNNK